MSCLTGSTPFERKRLHEAAFDEMLRIIREEEPPKPSTRLSTTDALPSIAANRGSEPQKLSRLVRGELDWIVMKALEKDRNRRYETANGLALDIQRYLHDEPVQACPPSARYRLRKFARRNKRLFAGGLAAAMIVVLGVLGLAASNVLIARERDQKELALKQKQSALQTAQTNYADARKQEALAKANERTASTQEVLARRRFYAAQINLATQAWQAGEMPRVLELLESQRPMPDAQDLRSFEWYYLWRLCHGGRRAFLHGHTGRVMDLAFFPDGKTLASGSADRTVRLWDPVTGKELAALRHPEPLWNVAISPDGKLIAGGGYENGSLILWDVATHKALYTIPGALDGIAFSPDGRTLATATGKQNDGTVWDVTVRDVPTGAQRASLVSAGSVIGFLPDGTLVTLANRFSKSSEVRFWDVMSGSRRLTIPAASINGHGPVARRHFARHGIVNGAPHDLGHCDWSSAIRAAGTTRS